jgi:hypothetical protein
MTRVIYSYRPNNSGGFDITMNSGFGVVEVIDSARSEVSAQKTAERWQRREDEAVAKAAKKRKKGT